MPVETVSCDYHDGEREQYHVDAHGTQPENRQIAGDFLGEEVPSGMGYCGHKDKEKDHCTHSENILILEISVVKYLLKKD